MVLRMGKRLDARTIPTQTENNHVSFSTAALLHCTDSIYFCYALSRTIWPLIFYSLRTMNIRSCLNIYILLPFSLGRLLYSIKNIIYEILIWYCIAIQRKLYNLHVCGFSPIWDKRFPATALYTDARPSESDTPVHIHSQHTITNAKTELCTIAFHIVRFKIDNVSKTTKKWP